MSDPADTPPPSEQPPAPGSGEKESTNVQIVYGLYLAAVLVGITSLIGVVMAYIFKGGAPEWVQAHYQFQIRTFWIGLLYGLITAVLSAIVIGLILIPLLLIWWIVRCVIGWKYVSRGEAVPNPKSWLFGN